MNLEQYIGCLINYRGRIATVTGARSNYDGDYISLQYIDADSSFSANAFERELMDALPDPEFGILKQKDDEVIFLFDEIEYVLGYHPYEPCLYIKKDGEIIRTLHNAFTTDELPERFAQGETLMGIDGKEYDEVAFKKVLIAAIASSRSEMDFPFAAKLSRTDTEHFEDYKPVCIPDDLPPAKPMEPRPIRPSVMNFCPKCGSKNNGGKFCTRCGANLNFDYSSPPHAQY